MADKIELLSYSTSGLGFLILSLLLLVSWRRQKEGAALIFASVVQLIWSVVLLLNAVHYFLTDAWILLLETLRSSVWIIFYMRVLTIGEYKRLPVYFSLPITTVVVITFLYSLLRLLFDDVLLGGNLLSLLLLLSLSIFGLLLTEQLYRNVKPERRWSIKFLCLGLGGMFIYDLYMYSDAVMYSVIDKTLWDARGIVNALIVPLIALSAARNPRWSFDIFVSRQVVFYSTGLLAIGIYLLLISLGGLYIRHYGGEWGDVIQVTFLIGSVLLLFVVLSSTTTRSRLKIFLTKHFYKNKYDYREEWLKLTHKISEYKSPEYFYEHVIQSIAELLQSTGGHLFVIDDNTYRCVMSWNGQNIPHKLPGGSELPVFLNKYEWIIDIRGYKKSQENYQGLILPEWLLEDSEYWLIIPLKHQYTLLGFVLLHKSLAQDEINWEDRDLLKAVGRQISSYLALIRTSEELNEAQQFSAFNKLSAFVVHDLKNQVAQLALIVKNSEKYKSDPQFITDAMITVENVVGRMQKLLSQLRRMRFDISDSRKVNVSDAAMKAIEKCENSKPRPQLVSNTSNVYVHVEPDRFVTVLEHLIQNAQEATADNGSIRVQIDNDKEFVKISIQDNGSGMPEAFIRDRLFKPFDTTKGNAGMGIGVFEAREFARLYDGSLDVQSKLGEGTVFELKLPQFKDGR